MARPIRKPVSASKYQNPRRKLNGKVVSQIRLSDLPVIAFALGINVEDFINSAKKVSETLDKTAYRHDKVKP
jgi:hypothetical protein